MGLFDFFKKDRGYDIHSLEFCEVGKDGKKETRPGLRLYDDARYVMPVVRMTSRVERTVRMTVRITNPEGVVRTYTLDAPLRPFENQEAHLSWWGSESRTAFSKTGTWRFEVLDENDEVVIEAPLEIASLDSLWEEKGWIQLVSGFEFCNTHNDYTIIDDWGTRQFMEPEYIGMRCRYMSYSKVEREVTYDVQIKNLATGKVKAFSHTVTLKPQGGWLQMCGWGNSKGNSYDAGKYLYSLYYRGQQLGCARFEVVQSPRQRGWIEPVSLVFFLFNTDKELQHWLMFDCCLKLSEDKSTVVKQQPFKANACSQMVAGFQFRSFEAGHLLKLTFRFYRDDRLIYTTSGQMETNDPNDDNLFAQDFELSGVIKFAGPNGELYPLQAGRYQVKVYIETEELAERFIMQQTLDLR